VTFRVWAPAAQRVELVLDGRRVAMTAGQDGCQGGWWTADVPGAGPGRDYGFAVNGGPPLPDPRSPWQPQGIHGPSRVVDPAAFRWTDGRWQAPPLAAGVVYELHVGTFTPSGTFDGAIERLDHLVRLGVTHVELMPINQFPGRHGWGYDGVDLFAPHAAYGGPEGLARLVDACHGRGLAVLLDVVYNHLGPAGNYLERFGPYFTERYATPWGRAVNLDGPESDEVRRFFCDNALAWLRDYHVDGLRLDAVHAFLDTSAVHFLEQLAGEVRALGARLGRHLVLVAESDLNDPRIVQRPEAGGYGIDAQWSDDFHHALHAALTGERGGYYADFGRLADLAKALRSAYVHDGGHSRVRRRRHGRPPAGLAGTRFLGYLQTHDQIGNRARGERSSHLLSPGLLQVGAALVLLGPFVPMLFQGEEWGASTPFLYFTDHDDPALARGVSEGRRNEFREFGWDPAEVPDPQAPETFARSRLDWSEPGREPHRTLLEWHAALVHLRREAGLAAEGLDRVRVRHDEAERWLVLERDAVTVACNLAGRGQRVPLGQGPAGDLALASDRDVKVGAGVVDLPPESVAVLRR
jgi:maltooligosyltrehalose trehalohydrolase